MKKIVLHSAALDRDGNRRDGGEILEVGPKADITPDQAKELIAGGLAAEHPLSASE